LFSLAALFPQEIAPVRRRAWLRFLPYLVSLVLAYRGLLAIHDFANPWRYIDAWGSSYRFMAAGILVFLVIMGYRLRTNLSPVARQQARIILWGSLLAFVPLAVWLAAPMFGFFIPWNGAFFLPLLLLFPLTIAIAILRYRMWDVDVIVNRTLVYSALTVTLGLVYIASVLLFENLFSPFTRHNQMAAVASTLAIVALFNPLRQRLQASIDALFYRRKYDLAKTLAAFGATLRDEVDLTRLTGRIEQIIWETMQPSAVHTWLATSTGYRVHLAGVRRLPGEQENLEIPLDDPIILALRSSSGAVELDRLDLDTPAREQLVSAGVKLILPLISHGELIGWLSLGRRLSERDYSTDDRGLLANLASQAGPAVRVAQMVRKEQAEALERERFEHELDLARVIQLALLPKDLPRLAGWQIDTHYQPARAVGGDFYDFIPLENRRLGVVIGDVAGKGVPAALLMATTRSVLRAVALQGFPPGQVLQLVNDQLETDVPDQMFITCLYAIIDLNNGRMRFANAGHNLPFRRSQAAVDELKVRGMPLGLMPDMIYEEKEAVLEPGDTLMLISDGLVEAHSPTGKMFGTQPLRELFLNEDGCKPRLVECALGRLAEFTGQTWEQEDDITMVVLHRDREIEDGTI
jgi:serine phosphatase RsbU (regulator of sigma subunit)